MRWTLALLLPACSGDKTPGDTVPPDETDTDTDTDTDADTDADTDTDTAAYPHSAAPETGLGAGPMAPAWYRSFSFFLYTTGIPEIPGGGGGGGSGTGTGTGGGTGAGGSGGGGAPRFWPRFVAFSTDFGFDGNGNMVAVDAGAYGTLPPVLVVSLADDAFAYEGNTSEEHWCEFRFELTGATTTAAVPPGGRLWWGYEWVPGNPISGNCNTPGWELEPLFWGDPRTDWDVAGIGWAVGEPTPEIVGLIDGGIPNTELMGGTLRFPPLFGATPEDRMYGYAAAMNAQYELELKGAYLTLLPIADLYPYP